MAKEDEEKTSFHTEQGTFCYEKMSFGLKNAGGTYQRLLDNMFTSQLDRNIEIYVDDMVIKSKNEETKQFLGYMITNEGIQANPEKVQAIINMTSPRTLREVQVLNGKLAALGRFLAKSVERALQGEEINYPSLEKVALALRLDFTRKRAFSLPNTAYPSSFIRQLIIITINPVPVSQAEPPIIIGTRFIIGTSFGFHLFQFSYAPRRLTMEEMLYKFIDKGKREHEEMGAFIKEFKTTNKLLLKERNNSLCELNFEVYGLLKSINDAQLSNYVVKGVTTRGDLGVSLSLTPYTMYEKLGLGEPKPIRVSLELADRPFLATAWAMIDVFNKKITPRVGNKEVIFDVDQSIKRSLFEDDKCYGFDYLDTTIQLKTQELLEYDQLDSFLVNNLEKNINQSDLGSCDKADDDFETPIWRIEQVNTPYSKSQETKRPDKTQSTSIPPAPTELTKNTRTERPSLHLEYTYLKGDEYCPVIISSRLTNKDKISLLQSTLIIMLGSICSVNKMPNQGLSDGFCFCKDSTSKLKIKGAKNLADDHLSRLENPNMGELIKEEILDKFPDENLMILKAKLNDEEPWYADYVNYIVRKVVPLKWTPERRKRFLSQARNYFWDEPYTFRLCPDNVMRRCVARDEILEILAHCHSGPTRGHHSASITGRKVYEAGFYWPNIFKDAKVY
nr:reverse transcriptase domain-containing protein [Tanacetum cinerariifolium]